MGSGGFGRTSLPVDANIRVSEVTEQFAMSKRDTTAMPHDHTFGLDKPMPGERRTMLVIAITAIMMVVEIATGVLFGSMALLADGLHMASHTVALTLAYFAYVYARRHARDESFSFGTGKVNSLAGFTGAILLAVFALMMAVESIERLINPVAIQFNQAIFVACAGLVVNAVSAVILGQSHDGGEGHDHGHEHGHGHSHGHGQAQAQGHGHKHEHDHNLRSAYLHVLADALTSVLAIVALLSGKFFGLTWMDPVMGIVGATLVANWSVGLIRITSGVLVDKQSSQPARDAIRAAIEEDGTSRVSDLHVWAIGPNTFAAIVAVIAENAQTPDDFKARIPPGLGIVHLTVEVNGECRMATRDARVREHD